MLAQAQIGQLVAFRGNAAGGFYIVVDRANGQRYFLETKLLPFEGVEIGAVISFLAEPADLASSKKLPRVARVLSAPQPETETK
jgi:hypothetical protein